MSRADRPLSWALALLVVFSTTGVSGQGPKVARTPQPVLVPAEPAWTVVLEAAPAAAGAADAERAYIALQSERVVALGRDDGRVVWTRDIGSATAPVVSAGAVYVLASHEVHALDAPTGIERWRIELDQPSLAQLALVGEQLLVGVEPSTILALSVADGSVVWRNELPSPPRHAAAGDDRRAYVALSNGTVAGLSTVDGAVVWQRLIGEELARPALVGDRVIVGSTANAVFALHATSGAIAWRWRVGGDVIGAAGAADTVFIASLDNMIRAVNRSNGNQRWKKPLSSRPAGPPTTVGDLVIVTGASPTISLYDGLNGTLLGTYLAPAEVEGPPLVPVSGASPVVMVVITRDGRAVGLRPKPPEPIAVPGGRRGAPPPATPPDVRTPGVTAPMPIPPP